MKQIPLTKEQYALVDDEDFTSLNEYIWCATVKHHQKAPDEYYATRKSGNKHILMHRIILNAPKGQNVDHIDGNSLNNQRANLRLATQSQNGCNRGKSKVNTSGYKGVFLERSTGRFRARIGLNHKKYHIGVYATAREAAKAYNDMAVQLHGVYAHLNILD